MTAQQDIIDKLCATLDYIRQRTYRKLMPLIRVLVVSRDKRIGIGGSILIFLSFTLTMVSPLWLLALGPILLGIPHVLADVLYLIVRQGFHKNTHITVFCGLPLVIIACGGSMLWGFAGCFAMTCIIESTARKKIIAFIIIGTLSILVYSGQNLSSLIFAHAHNFIAVVLWWFWRKQRTGISCLPLVVFGAICTGIISGSFDFVYTGLQSLGFYPPGMDLSYYSSIFAPGSTGSSAARLVLLFAFAQSVHYAVWLRLVPDEDHEKKTPRSFKETYTSISAELGRPVIWLAAIGMVLLGIWAVVDLQMARSGYLRMAVFHGYIELYALTFLALKGSFSTNCREKL